MLPTPRRVDRQLQPTSASSPPAHLYRDALQCVLAFLPQSDFLLATRSSRDWYAAACTMRPRADSLTIDVSRIPLLLSSPLRRHVGTLAIRRAQDSKARLTQRRLTHQFTEALRNIFRRFTSRDEFNANEATPSAGDRASMTREDLRRYLLACGESPQSIDQQQGRVDAIFDECAQEGESITQERLTFDDFCAVYSRKCEEREEDVWSDLTHLGFDHADLQPRDNSSSAESSSDGHPAPRVSLLEAEEAERDLTPRYRAALTIIFGWYATLATPTDAQKTISLDDLFERATCHLGLGNIVPQSDGPDSLEILGPLTLEGFISWHYRVAQHRAVTAWHLRHSLIAHGFGDDLKSPKWFGPNELQHLLARMPHLNRCDCSLELLSPSGTGIDIGQSASPLAAPRLSNLAELEVTFRVQPHIQNISSALSVWSEVERSLDLLASCCPRIAKCVIYSEMLFADGLFPKIPLTTVEALARIQSLTSLEWAHTGYFAQAWTREHMIALRSLRNLTELRWGEWTAEYLSWYVMAPSPLSSPLRFLELIHSVITPAHVLPLSHLTNLTRIDVQFDHEFVVEPPFLESMNQLESVRLRFRGHVADADALVSALSQCRFISELTIIEHPTLTDENLASLLAKLPLVRKLSLLWLPSLRSVSWLPTRLEKLALNFSVNTEVVADELVSSIARQCTTSLAECSLASHPGLTDDHLIQIMSRLPHLSKLVLHDLSNLRSAQFLRVLLNAPNLHDLDVNCSNIQDPPSSLLDSLRALSRLTCLRFTNVVGLPEATRDAGLLKSKKNQRLVWPDLTSLQIY